MGGVQNFCEREFTDPSLVLNVEISVKMAIFVMLKFLLTFENFTIFWNFSKMIKIELGGSVGLEASLYFLYIIASCIGTTGTFRAIYARGTHYPEM